MKWTRDLTMEELHENSHCRGGKVGEVICQELSTEENDIVLIDQNQDIIDRLMNKFDIRGFVGMEQATIFQLKLEIF